VTGILAACVWAQPVSATVQISDQSIYRASLGTTTASYSIANDGNVKKNTSTILEAWLQGSGGAVSDYEVRATVTSGSLTSGTTGSWLNCSTTRTWTLVNDAGDNSTITAVFTVEIRLAAAPNTVLDSATITLSAESDNLG
jgi:hypothetical protein